MKIKPHYLDRLWENLGDKVLERINQTMASGNFHNHALQDEVEGRIAKIAGSTYCRLYSNATAALTQALRILKLPEGARVAVPAFSFIASASCVKLAGYEPVFVDLVYNEKSYSMGLRDEVDAVVYVSLFGNKVNEKVLRQYRINGVKVIHDCAQGFTKDCVSPYSDITVLSFSPTKPCPAGGGAILTNDMLYDELAQIGRHHGLNKKTNETEILGMNSKMSTMEVAMLDVCLDHLEDWENIRRSIFRLYQSALGDVAEKVFLTDESGTCHKVVMRLTDRNERSRLISYMNDKGIIPPIHYSKTLDEYSVFDFDNNTFTDMSKKLSKSVVTIPNDPYMTDMEVETVCDALKGVV